MRITEIRVTPKNHESFRGLASITLDNCFVVRGLKIIEDRNGRLFVAMPNRRQRDGTYQDIAHPITPAFRNQLEQAVLGKYNRVLAAGSQQRPDPEGGEDAG